MHSLKALVYFSLFKYPLLAKEIYLFSGARNPNEINKELSLLENKEIVYNDRGFYCLNSDQDVSRRIAGNTMAEKMMKKGIKQGVFISKFPYISAVGISGSLSKNYYDKNSDIDFFVITKPKRLWIARTILMLYKKIFLLNSKKFFCPNYFISEDSLEISEKNIFTATELLTMIPIAGNFEDFYTQNQWVYRFLPNMKTEKKPILKTIKKHWISKIITFLLNNKIGSRLDRFFLRLTLKKWKIKFKELNHEDFEIAMKSTGGVSKHHPEDFQKIVINRLNIKYKELYKKHNIKLEEEHV